jgi:hypothetical protein
MSEKTRDMAGWIRVAGLGALLVAACVPTARAACNVGPFTDVEVEYYATNAIGTNLPALYVGVGATSVYYASVATGTVGVSAWMEYRSEAPGTFEFVTNGVQSSFTNLGSTYFTITGLVAGASSITTWGSTNVGTYDITCGVIQVTSAELTKLTLTNAACSNGVVDTTLSDEAQAASNTLYLCEGSNGTAEMQVKAEWLPTSVASNMFRWEIKLTNGTATTQWSPTNTAAFSSNPASITWTNKLDTNGLTNREFVVNAWFDQNTNGVFDPGETHRRLNATVLKVDIVQSNEFALVEDLTNIFANLSADSWTNVTWKIEPSLGATGALFSVGATNVGTTNLVVGTNVWICPGDIATNYTIVAYANELTNCVDTLQLRVLDVYPKAQTIYMFAGHTNDIVHLDVRPSNTDYVWSLASGSPTVGTFATPSNSLCQFLASTTGNNSLSLRCGGVQVWTKSLEVIPISPRSAWGAHAPNLADLEGMTSVSRITVHHSSDTASGTNEVHRIQDYHMSNWPYIWPLGKDYADIGYHYLQAQDSEIFEGRQLEGLSLAGGPYTKASQVESNNTAAGIGFCLMADYESAGGTSFMATRQLALEKALTALCRRHTLTGASISYHQAMDLSTPLTACPGTNVIAKMPAIVSNVVENLK